MESEDRPDNYLLDYTLVAFSLYTDLQYKMVRVLGEEIIQCFDETISADEKGHIRILYRGRYTYDGYSKFWFWTLGAYEIVRTMGGAKKCITPEMLAKLNQLKHKLGVLRIPFAKQLLQKEDVAVNAELSIYSHSASPPDLKFQVKDQVISARATIEEFAAVVGGIEPADILADFRTMYAVDE
jgi:hypothetical protein